MTARLHLVLKLVLILTALSLAACEAPVPYGKTTSVKPRSGLIFSGDARVGVIVK